VPACGTSRVDSSYTLYRKFETQESTLLFHTKIHSSDADVGRKLLKQELNGCWDVRPCQSKVYSCLIIGCTTSHNRRRPKVGLLCPFLWGSWVLQCPPAGSQTMSPQYTSVTDREDRQIDRTDRTKYKIWDMWPSCRFCSDCGSLLIFL